MNSKIVFGALLLLLLACIFDPFAESVALSRSIKSMERGRAVEDANHDQVFRYRLRNGTRGESEEIFEGVALIEIQDYAPPKANPGHDPPPHPAGHDNGN